MITEMDTLRIEYIEPLTRRARVAIYYNMRDYQFMAFFISRGANRCLSLVCQNLTCILQLRLEE